MTKKEIDRGQVPLTAEHYNRFGEITSHPDSVWRIPTRHMGHDVIEYSREFHDVRLIYTEHIEQRNAVVSFVTMRAYPRGKGGPGYGGG